MYVIRLGDGGEYEVYNSPYEAGHVLGRVLSLHQVSEMPPISRVRLGVEVVGFFEGMNYVSLFVVRASQQEVEGLHEDPVELAKLLLDDSTEFGELTAEELEGFLCGVKEGMRE